MGRDLYPVGGTYVEGTLWTPSGPNSIAQFSDVWQDWWTTAHRASDGVHYDPLIPVAWAICTVTAGVLATLRSSGMSAITRVAVGRYSVKLDFNMRAANYWHAVVWPTMDSDASRMFGLEAAYAATPAKTQTTVEINILDQTQALADSGFTVGVYGQREA